MHQNKKATVSVSNKCMHASGQIISPFIESRVHCLGNSATNRGQQVFCLNEGTQDSPPSDIIIDPSPKRLIVHFS